KLKRFYLHIAELHGSGAILKRNGTARVTGMLHIDSLRAIQNDDHVRSLCRDLKGIPLSSSLDWCRRLGYVDYGSRSVRRIRTLVVDIHFISVHGIDLLWVFTANKHAAVGIVIDPKLNLQLKIAIRRLTHQEARALVGLYNTLRH